MLTTFSLSTPYCYVGSPWPFDTYNT
jgi:hypothetical protein